MYDISSNKFAILHHGNFANIMAGIYIHIPFCKRICSYCDFYKSALTGLIPEYLSALEKEADARQHYLNEDVNTIYIGGGTPSLLGSAQIDRLINMLRSKFPVTPECEISLEANPDDLTPEYVQALSDINGLNRLSIGIQSFFNEHLSFLNRRHDGAQAMNSINLVLAAGFRNVSVDLIYGIPGMNMEQWKHNLECIKEVKHLSAYHLSIEPGTALWRLQSIGGLHPVGDEVSAAQYEALVSFAGREGFIHYEISNLAREGYFSRHNSNYWLQTPYLGLGPSAHSYNLISRQWNVSHVKKYIEGINEGKAVHEIEHLSPGDKYNEYVMVSLRTMWGLDRNKLRTQFGEENEQRFLKAVRPELEKGTIISEGNIFRIPKKSWLVSDYILSGIIQ